MATRLSVTEVTVRGPATIVNPPPTLIVTVTELAPGQIVIVTATVQVNSPLTPTTIVNTAEIAADINVNPFNDSGSVGVTVDNTAPIAMIS